MISIYLSIRADKRIIDEFDGRISWCQLWKGTRTISNIPLFTLFLGFDVFAKHFNSQFSFLSNTFVNCARIQRREGEDCVGSYIKERVLPSFVSIFLLSIYETHQQCFTPVLNFRNVNEVILNDERKDVNLVHPLYCTIIYRSNTSCVCI